MNQRRPKVVASFGAAVCLAIAPGCLGRAIQVASSPPGADVYMNGTPIGRTPATTGFEFYGQYDIRLRKDGFEPISASPSASMPLWEIPPFDLIASVLPITLRDKNVWEYRLEPSPDMSDTANRDAIIERARSLRGDLDH